MASTGTAATSQSRRSVAPSILPPFLLLALMLLFGYISMHSLIHRNGYYAALVQLRDFGPWVLPGSSKPLVRSYVGIAFPDYVLTVLQCFFASAFDGSSRELQFLCAEFAGDMGALMLVLGVEALRRGNEWSLVSL
jgi:hypothetical protein